MAIAFKQGHMCLFYILYGIEFYFYIACEVRTNCFLIGHNRFKNKTKGFTDETKDSHIFDLKILTKFENLDSFRFV